jgi:hypothetical protein
VTLFVKFSLDDDERLSVARESSGLYLIRRERLTDEAIEERDPSVRQGVGPCRWVLVGLPHWILVDLHDLGVRWGLWGASPHAWARGVRRNQWLPNP